MTETKPPRAKIILLDIETAPSLGYVWGRWQQDVVDFERPWYILSYAVKELDKRGVTVKGLIDYPGYTKDRENDKPLVADLWKVLDGADIVIAHNGDKFDIPKINARFVAHEMPPPSPFQTVDTRKLAKRFFRFDSNKLDDIGHYLGIGRKVPTDFSLWRGCMEGDPVAWGHMKHYNAMDVILLEKVYLKLRSWNTSHPTVAPGHPEACPKCGSRNIVKEGYAYTAYRKRQRYSCNKCKGWFSGPARGFDR